MLAHTPRQERRVQTFPAPAAGSEFSITPTGQGALLVLSFRLTLTTSAVAGPRIPILTADDGTSAYWSSAATPEQEPSSTSAYSWYPGAAAGGGDTAGPITSSATGAAAAAGNAALPAGADITGWKAIFEAPSAAVAGQITVTGIQGGTLTYDVQQELNAGVTVSDAYPAPGIPSIGGGSQIAVNIPAMVSGGAWSLTVTGTISGGTPRIAPLPNWGIHLKRGWRLRSTTSGLDVADAYSSIVAYVQEMTDAPEFQVDPSTETYVAQLDT